METRDTAENPTARLLAAEQRLLTEGVPAYLDAMVAIQEFRQTVQKRCRQVLRAGLEDFSRAIGMPLCAIAFQKNNYMVTVGKPLTQDRPEHVISSSRK